MTTTTLPSRQVQRAEQRAAIRKVFTKSERRANAHGRQGTFWRREGRRLMLVELGFREAA